jgi:hypothetical protein
MKHRKHFIFRILIRIIACFFSRRTFSGMENVVHDAPAVFVANHMGSYAPVIMTLFFPFPFRPWVTYQIVTHGVCTAYLENHFTKTEMKLRRPWSRIIAAMIAPFCVGLVRATGAIPVYSGSMKIRETINKSIDALINDNNLVIFPENDSRIFSTFINDFDSGFIHLGSIYSHRTGRYLNFYPVCVTKRTRSISIGRPIVFSSEKPFETEKRQIKHYLQESIDTMATGNK